MDIGLHIVDFTWDGGAPALRRNLAQHVRSAEAAGVKRITVMDHFWQIAAMGPPEHEMLSAYPALGFIAAHTEKALLHTLVTGVTYREPALLAKDVTTLDVLSGGRGGLGIGAAWNVEESDGLGFRFPPTKERFERLEEAIRVCLQMWSDSDGAFEGRHYRLSRTLNEPQVLTRPRPYLLIGGGGERKTLRLVAEYADACNLFASPEVGHKLDVLRRHCDDVGRDYDEVEKTTLVRMTPTTTAGELITQIEDLGTLGFTVTYVVAVGVLEPSRITDLVGEIVDAVG